MVSDCLGSCCSIVTKVAQKEIKWSQHPPAKNGEGNEYRERTNLHHPHTIHQLRRRWTVFVGDSDTKKQWMIWPKNRPPKDGKKSLVQITLDTPHTTYYRSSVRDPLTAVWKDFSESISDRMRPTKYAIVTCPSRAASTHSPSLSLPWCYLRNA